MRSVNVTLCPPDQPIRCVRNNYHLEVYTKLDDDTVV